MLKRTPTVTRITPSTGAGGAGAGSGDSKKLWSRKPNQGEGRVGEDVYEVFQVQAHAQLKETVLRQLMALQSTPAMIAARTLPWMTTPLLQLCSNNYIYK